MLGFEPELRKLFEDYDGLQNTTFVGDACYGDLDHDLIAKIQFIAAGRAFEYDTLQINILHRKEGKIDAVDLSLLSLLGKKKNEYDQDIFPVLLKYGYDEKARWNSFDPTPAEYRTIREATASYLDVFRQPLPEIPKAPPKQKKTTKAREQTR